MTLKVGINFAFSKNVYLFVLLTSQPNFLVFIIIYRPFSVQPQKYKPLLIY